MEYVWIFLLFFAVLAAAWFYLQRAKARPSATVTKTGAEAPATTDAATDTPDEPPTS